MPFQYEPLKNQKRKHGFLVSDFKVDESNKIITDLVDKITEYEQSRSMSCYYDKIMTNGGERILEARMLSKDSLVQGTITYTPIKDHMVCDSEDAKITAEFYFFSENELLKKEYLGLAKIIKKM